MVDDGAARVAQALLNARRGDAAADAAALAEALPDAAAAYRAQALVAQALEPGAPAVARHWKSGGPTREAVPTHAPLPAAGVWASPAQAGAWPFRLRLIEAEVALRLARDVSAADAQRATHADTAAWVDAMAVSIEVVDSRWAQGVQSPAVLKLADLQSHGALVLGAWVPFAPRDWSAQGCEVRIGARAPAVFTGTHSMGDPAWVLLAWLRHVARDGATVPAGTVVTTGTWCGMLDAAAGDRVTVQFPGIGEASVQL